MLTPCINRRAVIWILFFVISFFTVQLWDGEEATPDPTQVVQKEQKRG
ncbi:hypothetical protein LOK74_17035 [Brevibacillus humidisoli]|nr:hypothetical protein [Brevibacillus humidisoli]UFJ39744.1 hypothetical protein LOK74_17035 [Brevibacillus humidisoli]